jgi:hypothetical protein
MKLEAAGPFTMLVTKHKTTKCHNRDISFSYICIHYIAKCNNTHQWGPCSKFLMGLPIVKFPGEDFILPELQKYFVKVISIWLINLLRKVRHQLQIYITESCTSPITNTHNCPPMMKYRTIISLLTQFYEVIQIFQT